MLGLLRLGLPFVFGAFTGSQVSQPTQGGKINYLFWGAVVVAGLLLLRLVATTFAAVKKAF